MNSKLVILLVTVLNIGLLCSCSKERNEELDRLRMSNLNNFESCRDFDFTKDSLLINYMIFEDLTTRRALGFGFGDGEYLFGSLSFNIDQYLFYIEATFNDRMDTLAFGSTGTFEYEQIEIIGEDELEGTEYISFKQVNRLKMYADDSSEDSFEDIKQTVSCQVVPHPTHKSEFSYDGYDIQCFFVRP